MICQSRWRVVQLLADLGNLWHTEILSEHTEVKLGRFLLFVYDGQIFVKEALVYILTDQILQGYILRKVIFLFLLILICRLRQ